jgi:diguanylate cyclase (GGDEF)-like protein
MPVAVLIVEDDAAIRESIAEFIRLSGFEAKEAATAEEALALLESTAVDVVIADIRLPGLSGLDLTDIIKENYDIEVMVMTEYSREHSYEEAIRRGAGDFILKPIHFHELHLRLKRLVHLHHLMNERRQLQAELERLAITDDLTGLFNSRHFYDRLRKELDRAVRYGQPLALILMDIDHFKDYNDTHGHLEGDKILASLGKCLRAGLRSIDSAYRYGGEEFTVILPNSGLSDATHVAERLRQRLEKLRFPSVDAGINRVTVSMGVTILLRGDRLADFVKRADQAMYLSKERGRNRITALPMPADIPADIR